MSQENFQPAREPEAALRHADAKLHFPRKSCPNRRSAPDRGVPAPRSGFPLPDWRVSSLVFRFSIRSCVKKKVKRQINLDFFSHLDLPEQSPPLPSPKPIPAVREEF